MANLTQLKMLENLDGFLLVDKPEGLAFSTVVKAVKRNFNLVKVGHGGSLDAMASGLLVLLLNDANKFVDRVMGADRSYTGTIKFGLKTNTGDIKGVPVAKGYATQDDASKGDATRDDASKGDATQGDASKGDATFLSREEKIVHLIPQFKGDIFQTEPHFCTVRKEGSADYEIADTGEHKQFLAHVYRFEVEKVGGGGEGRFSLVASKSLIPRALVDDFGDALGCGAALASLRRTCIGKFDVAEAVPFQKLLETNIRDFPSLVQPIAKAL